MDQIDYFKISLVFVTIGPTSKENDRVLEKFGFLGQ